MKQFLQEQDYIPNFYRYSLYDKKKKRILITTDDGSFLFCHQKLFQQLKRGKITSEEFFNSLEDKGIILTQKNISRVIKKTWKRYAFLQSKTSLHIVIPTSRCNLACKYCFASPDAITTDVSKTDMTLETAKSTTEYIMNSPSNAITIEYTGGEALVNFEVIKYVTSYAKELNKTLNKDLRFTVVTNLSLMTEEKANWLMDNDVSICTSLDGPKEVHDANRIILGREHKEIGTYNQVIFWINKLNDMYEKKGLTTRVNALITTTKHSLNYYKEIIDIYVKLGIKMIVLRNLGFIGNATDTQANNENYYSTKEFEEFYIKSINYIEELQQQGIDIQERTQKEFMVKTLLNIPTFNSDTEAPWGALIGSIVYGHDGTIYACHEGIGKEEFKLGSIFTHSWKELFSEKKSAFMILSSLLENNAKLDRDPFKPYDSTNPIENFYKFNKFHFYPNKTTTYHETRFQCRRIFDKLLEKEN